MNLGDNFEKKFRKNHKESRDVHLEELDVPKNGLSVQLRGYGWVSVFKFVAKNGRIDYMTNNAETSSHVHE